MRSYTIFTVYISKALEFVLQPLLERLHIIKMFSFHTMQNIFFGNDIKLKKNIKQQETNVQQESERNRCGSLIKQRRIKKEVKTKRGRVTTGQGNNLPVVQSMK